jgi:uncharacterized protein (TIGR03118 family)
MNTYRWGKVLRFLCTLGMLAVAMTAQAQTTENFYQLIDLASDGVVVSNFQDPKLINGWGIASTSSGPFWVASNGVGVSTVYTGEGTPQPLDVQVPTAANGTGAGTPTGIVSNESADFVVTQGTASGPSRFIFATEDGVIAGWSATVDATHAIRVVDNSTRGAVYKGLAISATGKGPLLYAADFKNNRIDVFDQSFKPVLLLSSAFTDSTIPEGFAPFGIQAINGDIYVSYAKQDAAKHDDVPGAGLGYINVFDAQGVLVRRVISQGELNAPWGMALAPASFGKFANQLLVGNFGDGRINAYDPITGKFSGTLTQPNNTPIQIDGLWGIAFGNGYLNQPFNALFFAAGPGQEKHGIYGRIDAVANASRQ